MSVPVSKNQTGTRPDFGSWVLGFLKNQNQTKTRILNFLRTRTRYGTFSLIQKRLQPEVNQS
jgi:hypothetical protein